MNDRHLVITGMMGTGKSTVGSLVSKELGRPFLDTDEVIQTRFGKSVREIFEQEGEGAFRKAESELCLELAAKEGMVIATGGGFLVPYASHAAMRRHSIFCLDASFETLSRRIQQSDRPLAGNAASLFVDRQAAYQRIFHHVDTNQQGAKEVASEIVTRFKLEASCTTDRMRFIRMPLQAPYPVMVKNNLCVELPFILKWLGVRVPRVFVISNPKLQSLVADVLNRSCAEQGFAVDWVIVPEGERFKNLDTVSRVYDELLVSNAKRDDVVIAIGGGVVGDVAGFVAATYMRGLRFIQIPTSLLAMVDSSIGGKTGVDHAQGKNLIGAFKQPLAVLVDPTMLDTLPIAEYRSGMAEVVKHAVLGDPSLFEYLSEGVHIEPADLIFRALSIKANIVEEDPFEQGKRALLNLGHTFGHAFETMSGYNLRHGEAVAVGMVAACELSHGLGKAASGLRARVERVLSRLELPTRFFDMRIEDAMRIFQHDKKNTARGLRFVVPYDIGDVRVEYVNDHKLLERVLLSVAA